ncbi:hypothetical protein J1N35_044998 [Gossypium stocksii]|uniref:DUF7866 domain-containing protein n=2 Tax=Gossypium TaxID=3633 RepID=A0A9D3ZG55_9ROSI|nr:hypothetical protein J1N35_044998 [Gossypium stocksii]
MGSLFFSCFSSFQLLSSITMKLQAWPNCFVCLKVNGSSEMFPLVEEKMMLFNESRRKLGSFQICAVCTCCGGAKGACLPSPCCYAINCNIPNRPFGFCSFTPKTCNCFGCHL